jgi:hypothetical protein
MYGGLERHKARCVIHGDCTRPGVEFDEMRTASHLPSQSGRRFLLAVIAADGAAVQAWRVHGASRSAPATIRKNKQFALTRGVIRAGVSFRATSRIFKDVAEVTSVSVVSSGLSDAKFSM